jgi:hypothetical protein
LRAIDKLLENKKVETPGKKPLDIQKLLSFYHFDYDEKDDLEYYYYVSSVNTMILQEFVDSRKVLHEWDSKFEV